MDTYLPISEAARKVHVSIENLNALAQLGKIKAIMAHGEILLLESDVMSQQPRENFAHLEGQPIGIGEAARKYGVTQPTVSNWKNRGYLRVIRQVGQKIFVDESDVAYMAANFLSHPGSGRRTDLKFKK